MLHLEVKGVAACGATDVDFVVYREFDRITCEACRASLHGRAAGRILDAESHYTAVDMSTSLEKLGMARIQGGLGDSSKVDPEAPLPVRLRQRHATMSEHEKFEAFRRITEMAADTCPGCGGSIKALEHTPECLGPDPLQWDPSDEEAAAELELLGYDLNLEREKFSVFLKKLERELLERKSRAQ